MIRNYLKVALRNLMRNKVFSTINVLGLSVGLTVCTLLSLYIWHETHYDDYHPDIDRLYQVGTIEHVQGKKIRFQGCPNTLAAAFKGVFPEVEATARICPLLLDDHTLMQNGTSSFYEDKGFAADSGFFQLFKYDFVEGNPATAVSGPYSIVLSKDIADKLFGGGPALNKVIHISSAFDGDHDYTITGVFRPINKPSHIDARFFVSMYGGGIGDLIRTWKKTTSNYFFVTYVRLRPWASPAQIEPGLKAFVDMYEGNDLKAAGYTRDHFLIKVRDIHLHANMDYGDVTPGGSITYLYILGSIALFTLLIACINFMNLSTARSTRRSAEVGVRKTLGARQSTLVRQFLGESLLMALLAYVVSILLVWMLLPGFNLLAGKHITLTGAQLFVLGAASLVLAGLTGLLAGSYPALYLSSFKPVKVLKGKSANSLAVASVRKGLVVFQFGIAIILIVAVAIIVRQMQYLRNADLGFTKDQQLIIPLQSEGAWKLYTPLKAELQKQAGVESVGASFLYPGHVGWSGTYYADGQPSTDNHPFLTNYIDFDFMRTLGLQTVAGHAFTDQFPSDSVDGVVINETGARALGYTPATCIGKGFHNANSKEILRIVGVMKDFHFEDLHVPIMSVAFFVNSAPRYNYIIAHVNASNMGSVIAAAKAFWRTSDPNEPFEYSFLDGEFQKHYEEDNRLAALVGYATGIAIFISCLGLFGLAAFSAEQRTKEIGIRKVLGANVAGIVGLLSADFMKLVLLAVVLGSPVGWWATHRWLQDFAYRTTIPWTIFALTTGAALLIAFATISVQAFRAAMARPVDSLRNE
ncbi:ABC transporter permease [Dinghuibacter silviterrae]|uniref:Putative ABC transport system permease protein n=1 Tax=Dinghuibacter silviterrae TaxID=1539049 RepID=A0A4R8DUM9_9BACT|nr:ABC transporter permease [Dinghuibacter silviterrae]TDX01165.1 putative ABC transport system permease protein [Dinghuibacter silviterrae]